MEIKPETDFVNKVLPELQRRFPNHEVTFGSPLLYKLIIDEEGKIQPSGLNQTISRGQLAFQTDLLITKRGSVKVPLVVIEAKYWGFTTHDVITYSAKALLHKDVYPYLRYGLLIGGAETIDRKFFTHNSGFDFAFAMPDINESSLDELADIITGQIKASEALMSVRKGRLPRKYNTSLEIEYSAIRPISMESGSPELLAPMPEQPE